MHYVENTDLINKKQNATLKGQIEKIYYFEKIDKVILFEVNGNKVRVYEAVKMRLESTIDCVHTINAIEFITDRNMIAICLNDKTIRFWEILNGSNRFMRTLHVPSTQKCLSYVKRRRKELLFSGGTQGAVYAWNIELFFSGEYKEQPNDPNYQPNQDGPGPGGRKKEEVTRAE